MFPLEKSLTHKVALKINAKNQD